jgi:cytochrome P450
MPESKAIVFQAAFAGTSDPQKDLSFIDGDWHKETRQAAQAYIYRTIQNPNKTQPAACYLKDLAENDDDFKARLFSDAGILNGSMTKCGAGYDTPQKCWAK